MSELRQRQSTTASGSNRAPDSTATRRTQQPADNGDPDAEDRGISVVDIIRVLATLVLASCGLSYYMTESESLLWGYRPWFTRWPMVKLYMNGPINLTPSQLSLYNGTDPSLPIYLAVNASIFDVSANSMVYGPGGSYNFFAGRDATRAFVTGCFQEDLTPDLRGVEEMFMPVEDADADEVGSAGSGGLTSAQKKIRREREIRLARAQVEKTVRRWEGFFRNHKRYFQVGRVVDIQSLEGTQVRSLCEGAARQRPKRSEMDKS